MGVLVVSTLMATVELAEAMLMREAKVVVNLATASIVISLGKLESRNI